VSTLSAKNLIHFECRINFLVASQNANADRHGCTWVGVHLLTNMLRIDSYQVPGRLVRGTVD